MLSNSGRGGPRLGAGHPVGSKNQRSADIARQAADAGVTPLEVMLSAMGERGPKVRLRRSEKQQGSLGTRRLTETMPLIPRSSLLSLQQARLHEIEGVALEDYAVSEVKFC